MPYQVLIQKCHKSGTCVQECPMGAIAIAESTGYATIDPHLCTDCGSCADVCPQGAITGVSDEA